MTEAVLTLPDDLRAELKEPLGTVHADVDDLLATADVAASEAPIVSAPDAPVVAVGDVVTAHFLAAGHVPAVALVDERTERSAVDEWVATLLEDARGGTFETVREVANPAATLTEGLLSELADAVERAPDTTLIVVDGEEDLATLPAILAVPEGGHVVYGQPGEGMVLVPVDAATRERARTILERMDGDVDAAIELLSA